MPHWTTADIPDLTGRIAIVTGANSGLGLETSKALAEHGATVVMACRDAGRCDAAARAIRQAAGGSATLEPMALDLADLDSVRTFAEQFAERHDALDILVNNAGVMATPHRMETKQGFELQFGVNHLGHFALTGLLLPRLLATPRARVVTVSSFAHESGRMEFDDLQREHDYTPYGAYSQSKLANILFMLELDKRLHPGPADTMSVGAHPGFSSTNLQATGPFLGAHPLTSYLVLAGVRVFGQSPAHGAAPQLYAATAHDVLSGEYFGPSFRAWGRAVRSSMAPQARNKAAAARLWDVSKELTGVDPDAAIGAER